MLVPGGMTLMSTARSDISWALLLDVRLIASTKTARSLAVGDSCKDVCSCALCDNTLGHFGAGTRLPETTSISLHVLRYSTLYICTIDPGTRTRLVAIVVSILTINRTTLVEQTQHRNQISSPNSTHGKGNQSMQ